MKLTKNILKKLIKEAIESDDIDVDSEGDVPGVRFLDREAWKMAKGIKADQTTDDDLNILRQAFPDKNIVDPFDGEQIRRATLDASERDVIALGKVDEEIWFKLGAPEPSKGHQYGKLTSSQSEEGNELGQLDTKANLGGYL
tara:strand:+ start:7278 stop:7703 length:426 start_codon:yes stop_codon:yes gene_type:complete